MRRSTVLFLVILVAIAVLAILMGMDLSAAKAESCPSASPSATASPSPAPATSATVHWATSWQKAARRARAGLCRVRECFGQHPPIRVVCARPARAADAATWRAFGKMSRHQALDWRGKMSAGIAKMKHPDGSGAARWRPLALYVGWPPACLPQLLYIIDRESNGQPGAVNSSSGCAGLLQIHPCHGVANVLDPMVNLRAGLRLYREAGWSPWAL